MKKMAESCTNADFKGTDSKDEEALTGGFENKCALCVVLTQIIENYIGIHKKDVTDFIER